MKTLAIIAALLLATTASAGGGAGMPICNQESCEAALDLVCNENPNGPDVCRQMLLSDNGTCSCECWGGRTVSLTCIDPRTAKPPKQHELRLTVGAAVIRFEPPAVLPSFLPTCDEASCGMELALLCMDDGQGPDMCRSQVFSANGSCSCTCWGGEIVISACVDPGGIQEGPDGFTVPW